MAAIGIMDGAYFVGRNELLGWVNSTLGLNLTKIEQTSSGAVACQLMDVLHPGLINLSKVDFNAKNDYDAINNYKVLQGAFSKLNIEKPVEVNKLIKGRPLDNMEFMQWFKSYFDSMNGPTVAENYDGPGRRASAKTGEMKLGSKLSSGAPKRASASTAAPAPPAAPANGAAKAPAKLPMRRPSNSALNRSKSDMVENQSSSHAQELMEQIADLKAKVEGAERERDFYFDKLRDIEILCQTPELQTVPIVKIFERILYAADEKEAKDAMLDAQKQYSGSVQS